MITASFSKSLLYAAILSCILLLSCQNRNNPQGSTENEFRFNLPDSLSSQRLELVLLLRERIAKTSWKGFNDKPVEGPFNYYNGHHSEIFFPDSLILSKLDTYKKFSEDYVLSPRTDTIPYHFELMISFDPADSLNYYYRHPVQQFLSVEETQQFIPSVSSTEWWATMVIHEMFHHHQYNHPAFIDYARSSIGKLPFDVRNLRQLFQTDTTFMNMIRKENNLLLKALEDSQGTAKKALLREYLSSRNTRISTYEQEYEHLEQVENYYVIQEGAARYIEYQAMLVMEELSQGNPVTILENDPLFKGYEEFRKVDLNGAYFNYLTYAGPDTWHYAIGFNLMRMLDKLKVDYKQELLELPEKALPAYLEEYLENGAEAK